MGTPLYEQYLKQKQSAPKRPTPLYEAYLASKQRESFDDASSGASSDTPYSPRGIRGGVKVATDAIRNPREAVKGMAQGISRDYKAATNPNIIGGYKTDVEGYDPFGIPFRRPMSKAERVTKDTPGAQTLGDYGRGARNTTMNAVLGVAPFQGLLARSVMNAGAGAVQDDEDRVRGATAGLLLGEIFAQGMKAPGRAGRAVKRATDVSEGAWEGVARDMARETRGTSPPELMGSRAPRAGSAAEVATNRIERPSGKVLTDSDIPVVTPRGKAPRPVPVSTKAGIIRESGGLVGRDRASLLAEAEAARQPLVGPNGEVVSIPKSQPRSFEESFDVEGKPVRPEMPLSGRRRRPAEEIARIETEIGPQTARLAQRTKEPAPRGNVDAETTDPTYIPTTEAVRFARRSLGSESFAAEVAKYPHAAPDADPGVQAMGVEMAAREIVRKAQKGEPLTSTQADLDALFPSLAKNRETASYPLPRDIEPVATANGDFEARPGVVAKANRELAMRGPEPSASTLPRITPEDIPDTRPRGVTVEEANRRIEAAVAAQKASQVKQAEVRGRWAPGESLRNNEGALIKDLTNVPDEVLEAELRRIQEINAAEEAQAAAVRESAYRENFEELPRTERLGRRGQEDLPDADGMVDSDRLAADNQTVADYNKNTVVRAARARAAARLEAELAARKPEKYRRIEDEPSRVEDEAPEDTSFDFGSNAPEEAPAVAAATAPKPKAPPDHRAEPRQYMNWARANYNGTIREIVEQAVERGRASGAIDKGSQTFDEMSVQAQEFKSKIAKQLVEDPLALSLPKLRGITGAEIEGLKLLVGENTAVLEAASKVMNDPSASLADVAQATEMFERATTITNDALAGIVTETAQTARSLGYMRNTAKHSLDPEVWLVQAKRVLDGRPMSDAVMLNIRKLAQEAQAVCRG